MALLLRCLQTRLAKIKFSFSLSVVVLPPTSSHVAKLPVSEPCSKTPFSKDLLGVFNAVVFPVSCNKILFFLLFKISKWKGVSEEGFHLP